MIDILLISDQPRLHEILAAKGKLPDGTLRITTTLNQGLSEIASRSPDLIFLQNRLSGLAGFILVRHVREQAGSSSTKIVLLTDGLEGSENSSADIELLTGVSNNELSDAISEIIGDQLGLHKGAATSLPPGPYEPIGIAAPAQSNIKSDVADNVSLSTAAKTVNLPSTMTRSNPLNKRTGSDATEPLSSTTILSSNPPPIQWETKRLVIAISTVAVLIATGLLAAIFFSRTPDAPLHNEPAARTPVASPVVSPVQNPLSSGTPHPDSNGLKSAARLPSFIPSTGRDVGYSTANPGWERYTSAAREYKVFHESGAVKAIQVLDRRPGGISTEFFSSVIREVAKVRDYHLVSRELKGEYLIKNGTLSPSADIILYKDRSDKILRAFVIYFIQQENTPVNKGPK